MEVPQQTPLITEQEQAIDPDSMIVETEEQKQDKPYVEGNPR